MVSQKHAFANFLRSPEDATGVSLDFNTRIQILDSVTHLPTADKKQCGALIVSLLDFTFKN